MVDPLVRVRGLLAAEAVNRTPATSVSLRGPRIRAAELCAMNSRASRSASAGEPALKRGTGLYSRYSYTDWEYSWVRRRAMRARKESRPAVTPR